MTCRLSREADEDIVRIYVEGVRRFGQMQAETYHEELKSRFELLADSPRIARRRFELSPPMRIHPFEAHLIVYRIEEGGDVFIVLVRHGHEDWAGTAS